MLYKLHAMEERRHRTLGYALPIVFFGLAGVCLFATAGHVAWKNGLEEMYASANNYCLDRYATHNIIDYPQGIGPVTTYAECMQNMYYSQMLPSALKILLGLVGIGAGAQPINPAIPQSTL